jgi:AcrR family transcriptional regulator
MRKRDTRERVEDAAVRLFAARGYEGTGIRDIAKEAKVSLSTLYHYMEEKEDLLMEIMERALREQIEQFEVDVAGASGPTEELWRCVRSIVKYHAEHQLVARVADHELMALSGKNRRRILARRDSYEEIWAGVIARGVEDGQFEIEDQKMFRLAAIQMCVGVATWYSPKGSDSLESIADKFGSLVLAMAKAKRSALD